MTYQCLTCGQETEEPPWHKARVLGFNPDIHCVVNANAFGKISKCQSAGVCEWCKFYKAVTQEVSSGIGGRKIYVLRRFPK